MRCSIPSSGSTAGSHWTTRSAITEGFRCYRANWCRPERWRRRTRRRAGQRDRQRRRRTLSFISPCGTGAVAREGHRTDAGAHGGIGGAGAYVADELSHPGDQGEAAGPARALVAQLIDAWPAPRRAHPFRRHGGNGSQSCADALRLLRRLGDETTTRRFLHEIATAHYSGKENAELLETVATISPATLHGWLPGFSAAVLPRHPEAALDFLRRLCEQAQSRADGARRAALRDAARAACNALPEIVRSDARPDPAADLIEDAGHFGATHRRSGSGNLSAHAIRCLFALTWHCELAEAAEAAAAFLTRHPLAR